MPNQSPEQIAAKRKDGEEIALLLGNDVLYNGPWFVGEKFYGHTFTDAANTGTTFLCHDLEDCKQRLEAKRRQFGAAPPEFLAQNGRYNNTAMTTQLVSPEGCPPGQVPRPRYGEEYIGRFRTRVVCIDRSIAALIDRLNDNGYKTNSSCSGLAIDHPGQPLYDPDDEYQVSTYGFIRFDGLNKKREDRVRSAAKKHGLDFAYYPFKKWTVVSMVKVSRELARSDPDYPVSDTLPDNGLLRLWNSFVDDVIDTAMTLEAEVLSQYPIGNVPDNTEKETSVPESPFPSSRGRLYPPKKMSTRKKRSTKQGGSLLN